MTQKDKILKEIAKFYLGSRDFNGLPILNLIQVFELEESELKKVITDLIKEDSISLTFGDVQPNPHIKAFKEEPREKQIERLQGSSLEYICAYPSCSHLTILVDPLKYQDRPFTHRLALGEPQLSFESFDLSVLEFYRNDPRYSYTNNDINGSICISDEYFESGEIPESDQILLQTFGFSYDSELNRAVAVFLRYLSDLSPQHQQIWNAKIIQGDHKLHPDYYRPTILGDWPERISIFDAFGEELHHINKICELMGRPPLFKNELRDDAKPRGFCFLIRPTAKEFSDFILLFDKAISENINKEFFLDDVQFEYDEVRGDGKVIIREKGTIQILDEWLKLKFTPEDPRPMQEMIDTFKEIRRLRQRPAHVIEDNVFDQKYFKMQRELIIKAYTGIRLIRLIFQNFPGVQGYEIPEPVKSGKIWTY